MCVCQIHLIKHYSCPAAVLFPALTCEGAMTYGVCHLTVGVVHLLSQVLEDQIYPQFAMIPYSTLMVAETTEFTNIFLTKQVDTA
jgi:hypothetical protein